jgi:hypothetical protein
MTEEKPKQGKPARRGGRGRKRNPNRRHAKAVPRKPVIPPSPQVKVTIRNIQDSNKYGSSKAILEQLLPKLLEKCVDAKTTSQFVFDVDRKAVRHLLDEEEKFNECKAIEKAKLEEELKATQSGNGTNENSETYKMLGSVDDVIAEEEVKTSNPDRSKTDDMDIVYAPRATNLSAPTITVRPMYVIPARMTRRRGEKAGTAYVLLIAPKVDDESVNRNKDQDKKDPSAVRPLETTISSDKSSRKTVTSTPPVDYTRQLARCRLVLSNALEALREVAALDSKTQEHFAGCIVEQSLNGKTWKIPAGRPDRREGTVEASLEFKKWLELTVQQKEVLKSRPKPTPGGGSVPGVGGDGPENDETVAALVQHLLAKKEEIRRQKGLRNKKDDSKRKPKKNEGITESTTKKKTRRGGRGGAKADSRDVKKVKKKDKPPRKKRSAAPAPTAVLKPPSSS